MTQPPFQGSPAAFLDSGKAHSENPAWGVRGFLRVKRGMGIATLHKFVADRRDRFKKKTLTRAPPPNSLVGYAEGVQRRRVLMGAQAHRQVCPRGFPNCDSPVWFEVFLENTLSFADGSNGDSLVAHKNVLLNHVSEMEFTPPIRALYMHQKHAPRKRLR
jgi:hypothetical protein